MNCTKKWPRCSNLWTSYPCSFRKSAILHKCFDGTTKLTIIRTVLFIFALVEFKPKLCLPGKKALTLACSKKLIFIKQRKKAISLLILEIFLVRPTFFPWRTMLIKTLSAWIKVFFRKKSSRTKFYKIVHKTKHNEFWDINRAFCREKKLVKLRKMRHGKIMK